MTYEELKNGWQEETRTLDAVRERTDRERTFEALARRGTETAGAHRSRLEGYYTAAFMGLTRRRRLMDLCREEAFSMVHVTDERRRFFTLKEGEDEKAFENLKGHCVGHREWLRFHERTINKVSVALGMGRVVPFLTPEFVEPISNQEATSLKDIFEKQEMLAKVWAIQYALQFHAKVIKKKRTPIDYFAEFRVWVWTRTPDDYPEDLMNDLVVLLEDRYGGGWVQSSNVEVQEPPELQVRDQVDVDEALDFDKVHFHVAFWKVSGENRVVVGEYWGMFRRELGVWTLRESGRMGGRMSSPTGEMEPPSR